VAYDRSLVESAFASSGMGAEVGPITDLFVRTALTGEPYASDFGTWLRTQSDTTKADPNAAVATYLRTHGPGHWAFSAG
jgi:hypothetical protein